MKKILFASAVCASLALSATANAEGRVSISTIGTMDHVIRGQVPAPIVTWHDNSTDIMPKIGEEVGYLTILLGGSTSESETRHVLLAETCDGSSRGFKFVNATGMNDKMEVDHIPASFSATASLAETEWTGTEDNYQWRGYHWYRTGEGEVSTINVGIIAAERPSQIAPGKYTATYCIQQMIG